jgi:ATP-dependent Clp protease adaptor protein ClpS
MSETSIETTQKVAINIDTPLPNLYSIIYHNDDKTSSVFVVQSLLDYFGYSIEAAIEVTKSIDETGVGVVATGLTEELANHLRNLVVARARAEDFPLVVEVKAE